MKKMEIITVILLMTLIYQVAFHKHNVPEPPKHLVCELCDDQESEIGDHAWIGFRKSDGQSYVTFLLCDDCIKERL